MVVSFGVCVCVCVGGRVMLGLGVGCGWGEQPCLLILLVNSLPLWSLVLWTRSLKGGY